MGHGGDLRKMEEVGTIAHGSYLDMGTNRRVAVMPFSTELGHEKETWAF